MIAAGIIGWPVAHSKSPLIHRFWLAKLGIDGDYSRFAVAPENLGEAVRALPKLGLAGVNVTVPHKVAATRWLDRVDEQAGRVGAINTVIVEPDASLTGYNTDVTGIAAALEGVQDRADGVVIIGAGGAARAALAAVSGKRHSEVLVVARDPARAVAITRPFRVLGVGVPFEQLADTISDADLVINASPLGMVGQPSFATDVIDAVRTAIKPQIVFDMVYSPLETALLAAARKRGSEVIDGLQMLVAQAAAAFALFYGQPAPREHDAELRALLTA